MKLRLDLQTAYNENVLEHPQIIMRKLGITYTASEPQSIADCWFFYGCENTPNPLPKYLVFISNE